MLMLMLGLSGRFKRVMQALPMPIVMGMVARVFIQFGVDLVLALRDDLALAAPMAIDFVALLIAAYRIFDPAGAAGDRSRSALQR